MAAGSKYDFRELGAYLGNVGNDRVPDQAAGEALASGLASIGYAHLAVAPMHEALSTMSIVELERLLP